MLDAGRGRGGNRGIVAGGVGHGSYFANTGPVCAISTSMDSNPAKEHGVCPVCSSEFVYYSKRVQTYCSRECWKRRVAARSKIETVAMSRFMSKVSVGRGCWNWTGKKREGYGRFYYQRGWVAAHRWHWERVVGPIQNGIILCHRCDNPSCVRIDHLFPGTNRDNSRDREAKGRIFHPSGELHPQSRLSTGDVLEIRRRADSGENKAAIAIDFGVTRTAVYLIWKRRCWTSVPG